MSHEWPEVPQDRPVYVQLSTDFWPWPEVLSDLARRANFSGALEVQQDNRRGRAYWADGQALGTQLDDSEVDLPDLSLMLPRALVSLYETAPAVTQLTWECRSEPTNPTNEPWQTMRASLVTRNYSGIVHSPGGSSYWLKGSRVAGREPQPADHVSLQPAPMQAIPSSSIVEFYNTALQLAAREFAVEAHWRATTLELADEHLCLDPFAREVLLEGGQLKLNANVPAEELLPALRDAFLTTLRRAGRSAAQLPLGTLHSHPVWADSGLQGA